MKILNYLIPLFFILTAIQAQAESNCNAKYPKPLTLEYNFNGRLITVIGWGHPLKGQHEAAFAALLASAGSVQKRNCAEAEKILQTFLKSSSDRLAISNKVLSEINHSYKKRPFATIGAEASPEELREVIDSPTGENRVARLLEDLDRNCKNLKSKTDDFFKIFPGPEYYFQHFNSAKVSIKGPEDQKAKSESLVGVSNETLNYDPDKEKLSKEVAPFMKKMKRKIKSGNAPTEKEIQDLVNAEPNVDQKRKFRRIFSDLSRVMGLVDRRNKAIAENIVKEKGDFLLLIGKAHLSGLEKQFESLCKAETDTTSNASPTLAYPPAESGH